MREDSIDGIFDTLKQCALISKSAGGPPRVCLFLYLEGAPYHCWEPPALPGVAGHFLAKFANVANVAKAVSNV